VLGALSSVWKFLIQPALALGAAAGFSEFAGEPLFESFGASVTDEVD
jgi:hypothetical protein